MCMTCVIDEVKGRMLSRRSFFRGAGASVAAAAATAAVAPPALAQGATTVEDLTHELFESFPTFGGEQQLFIEQPVEFARDGYNLLVLTLNEHTGTHMDAPLHFSQDGASVAEIPVGDLVVPLCVVDIRARAAEDPDARVTPDDLAAWIAANGPIPNRACVAMLSGWAERVGGETFRNADEGGVMHFPGFHVEAAQMLMEETGAVGMAVDTLSLDHGPSADFATHYAWLPSNRWGLECVAGLDRLPAAGATLVVGAPKLRGGTGGPSRVFALV